MREGPDACLFEQALYAFRGGTGATSHGPRFHEHVKFMNNAAAEAETAVSATGTNSRGIVKLSIGPTIAAHWLMPHLARFIQEHSNIEIELVTHPFPVSVRRREADLVLRIHQPGDENLIGRKIARLGVGFYASRDYAARRKLPEHRDD